MKVHRGAYLVNDRREEPRTYCAWDMAALDELIIKLTGRSIDTYPWRGKNGEPCSQGDDGAVPNIEDVLVAHPFHVYYRGEDS